VLKRIVVHKARVTVEAIDSDLRAKQAMADPLPVPEPAAPVARYGDRNHGRAVQVNPIKPTLKPPGSERLKLNAMIGL
jgi:hypothetical protein